MNNVFEKGNILYCSFNRENQSKKNGILLLKKTKSRMQTYRLSTT